MWEGQMMDTRCVKILRQDERFLRSHIEFLD